MRILIVNKYAHVTGGADRHCLELATALRAEGHEVAFLATADSGNVERHGLFVGAKVSHGTRDGLRGRAAIEVAMSAVWNAHTARAMRTLIRDFRPDVVHAHKLYPQMSVAPVLVARRHGVPVVQTIHDYEFVAGSPLDAEGRALDRAESSLRYQVLNSVLGHIKRTVHVRCVDEWIAVSPYVASIYQSHGIDARVIPNFVLPGESVSEASAKRVGITFLGRLVPEKGVEDVCALARDLPHVPVRVAGSGPLQLFVEKAARETQNLTALGQVDSSTAASLLAESRICVLPSRWAEPGPLVALEAMRAGTPVVAYEAGGLADYIHESGSGMVIPPRRRDLAEACRQLLSDDSAWTKCSEAAKVAARTTHSVECYIASLEKVYEKARLPRRMELSRGTA